MMLSIIQGDALAVLRTLPSEHFHCVVTSPPYWGLRDYGTGTWEGGDLACDHLAPLGGGFNASGLANYDNGLNTETIADKVKDRRKQFRDTCGKCGARRIDQQIGLEPTPDEWCARLVEVFREVKRVLRSDGVCFVNLGSSFVSGGTRASQSRPPEHAQPCGIDGIEPEGSLEPDSACSDHGDEYQAGSPSHHGHTPRIGQLEQRSTALAATTAHDTGHQASIGAQPSALGALASTSLSSPPSAQDVSGRVDAALACPSAELTDSPAIPASVHRASGFDTPGTAPSALPSSSRTDRGPVFAACGDPSCSGHCGICWSYLAIPRLSLKTKDLLMQPHLLALALQADGWWVRMDICWGKTNPMPESVRDRCTKSHEFVFHLAKSGDTTFWVHRDLPGTRTRPAPDYRWVHKTTGEEVVEDPGDPENWKRINLWSGRDYFYDAEAVREQYAGPMYEGRDNGANRNGDRNDFGKTCGMSNPAGRNLRSVWTIATDPLPSIEVDGEKLDHFASYPVDLARRCILAGTSAKGCCPECGAPWARVVERLSDGSRCVSVSEGSVKALALHGEAAMRRGPGTTFSNTRKSRVPGTIATGWCPTCSCDAGDPVPARVLDPFGGSGRTALAAEELGRDCTLIELSEKSCAMAKAQLERAKARRFIGESERVPVSAGQLGLFDD